MRWMNSFKSVKKNLLSFSKIVMVYHLRKGGLNKEVVINLNFHTGVTIGGEGGSKRQWGLNRDFSVAYL